MDVSLQRRAWEIRDTGVFVDCLQDAYDIGCVEGQTDGLPMPR